MQKKVRRERWKKIALPEEFLPCEFWAAGYWFPSFVAYDYVYNAELRFIKNIHFI
jgi:hypothetical protein